MSYLFFVFIYFLLFVISLVFVSFLFFFFFFKQKTAYEIRLSLVGSEKCIRDTLTPDQTVEVLELHRKGIGNTEIAKQFGVSRQTIYKYIYNAEHFSKDPDFTMRMNFMNGQQLCTVIDIDFKHEVVRMKNYTDRIPLRAFGVVENPSWADFEEFLKERCLPASRAGLKDILREMEVPFFDPLLIIEKTNGRMAGDHQWVQVIHNTAV